MKLIQVSEGVKWKDSISQGFRWMLRSWPWLTGPGVYPSSLYIQAIWHSLAEIQISTDSRVSFFLRKCLHETGPGYSKDQGKKESLKYMTAIFCKIRLQLLFSFSLELKIPQVSSWEATAWILYSLTISNTIPFKVMWQGCMIRLCVGVGILCLCVTLSLGFAKSEIPCISTGEDNPACGRSSKCHPLLSIPTSFFFPHFSSLSCKCLKSFLVNNAGPLWKLVAEGWTLVIATHFVTETGNPWLLSSDQLRGREPPLLTAL